MSATVASLRPVSEAQIKFIKSLLGERDTTAVEAEVIAARRLAVEGLLSSSQASGFITLLQGQPKKPSGSSDLKAGVYTDGVAVIRVYLGQQSGKLLAKAVDTVNGEADYDYLGLASRYVDETFHRMTLDEVGAMGKTSGTCIICGRRLDDPESVDRGIGPICAAKYDI